MREARALSAGVVAAVLATLIPGLASAQTMRFQYAAKFVCGFDPPPAFVRVAPGQYATSVAVHNPQRTPVLLRKKVALTFPPAAQAPGEVSAFLFDELGPDQALQVDCEEIGGHPPPEVTESEFFPGRNLFGGGFPPYIQGFVIIESSRSVDVTAIVSVGMLGPAPGAPPGNATSLDVTQVRERRIGDN